MAQINQGWYAVGRLQGGSLGEGHAGLRLLAFDIEGARGIGSLRLSRT